MKSLLFLFATVALVALNSVQLATPDATTNILNEENEDAKLLVNKEILNNYIVEGADVTINYIVYNVGNLPAVNVKLSDDNFPRSVFEYSAGFDMAKWPKIQPTTNVSHTVIFKPKINGLFNFTSASVTYISNEKTAKVQTGYSTEVGEVYILRLKDYNRRFASHTIDWILFAVMASPSILFPYFLWYSSKSKYEKKAVSGSPRKSD